MTIIKEGFIAEGSMCKSCEKIIVKQATKIEGVKEATFDYTSETGYVTFDDKKTNINEILTSIEEKKYSCYILDNESNKASKVFGWIFGLIGIVLVLYFLVPFIEGIQMPTISANMGYGLLFAVGLLTGLHCIAMCGGFVVSYTANDAKLGRKSHISHLMYGTGKTLSYTFFGAVFGLIGSIFAFTPTMRGVAGLLAGLFLILFGLKMLNIIPALRKIHFRAPKFINKYVGKKYAKNSSPLIIGLLNGLMIACGPLQAIYVMAAGTGSMIEGAKLLFIFGIGTLPAMMGFAYFTSFISSKATSKILKASGVIVIVLGLMMLNNGLALTGTGFDFNTIMTKNTQSISSDNPLLELDGEYQVIRMEVNRYGWSPDKFVLKKGVPVKWIIDGKEINGCNNAIQVPKYGLKFDVKPREQTIEFTPTETGVVSWSCWMGMIPGTFIVKDDLDLTDTVSIEKELNNVQMPVGGTCGAGGGGCGCGGSR